jgi:hypothetical protein
MFLKSVKDLFFATIRLSRGLLIGRDPVEAGHALSPHVKHGAGVFGLLKAD